MEKRYCHFGIPYLDIKNYELDTEIVKIIPEDIAFNEQIIAIDKWKDILTIGFVNESSIDIIISKLENFLPIKYKILPILINLSDWKEVIQSAYIDNTKEIDWRG